MAKIGALHQHMPECHRTLAGNALGSQLSLQQMSMRQSGMSNAASRQDNLVPTAFQGSRPHFTYTGCDAVELVVWTFIPFTLPFYGHVFVNGRS